MGIYIGSPPAIVTFIMDAQKIAISQPMVRFRWIVGQYWDLGWFFLPVLLAILCFAATDLGNTSNSYWLALLIVVPSVLSWFHNGATWFHYLDSRNRKYYSSTAHNALIFLYGPLLVFLATVILDMTVPWLAVIIFMGWSLQHLVKQNTGILLLYHNYNCGEAIPDRKIEQNSQYAWSTFFTLLFVNRVFMPPSMVLAQQITLGIAVIALLWAVKTSSAYIIEMRNQVKGGAYVNVPAFLFWLLSLFWFAPLGFFGHSFTDAVLIPNIMHWCQYIGLNYLLTQRKYATAESMDFLPLRQPVLLYLLAGFALVASLALASYIGHSTTVVKSANLLALGIVQGLANTHYFQDAFLWRFREAHNRSAILQYLKVPKESAERTPQQAPH